MQKKYRHIQYSILYILILILILLNGGQDQPTKFWITAKNCKYIAYKAKELNMFVDVLVLELDVDCYFYIIAHMKLK